MTDQLEGPPPKTMADFFRDWESTAFGYGTGEPFVIPVLKAWFSAVGRDDASHGYDCKILETAVGPISAWLLINRLCQLNVIEYGTSPRFGWLTTRGKRLRGYINSRTADELLEDLHTPDNYHECYPDHCNCDGPKCVNPFWTDAKIPAPDLDVDHHADQIADEAWG